MDSPSTIPTTIPEMPSLFLAHGSPMNLINNSDYSKWLKTLGDQFNPSAIVVFSAHWDSETFKISSRDTIYDVRYDFEPFEFPKGCNEYKYPVAGSTKVASMLKQKFANQGIEAELETERGIDHGAWTLLCKMYPNGDIPVVTCSINSKLSPKEVYKYGEVLRGLGKENILVISSGITVHNLALADENCTHLDPWAVEFDDWLLEALEKKELEKIFDYEKQAPHVKLAVPTTDHFFPLLIALGNGNPENKPKIINRHYEEGNLSYLCLQF